MLFRSNDVRSLRTQGFSVGQQFKMDSSCSNSTGNHDCNQFEMNQLRILRDEISKDDDEESSSKNFNYTLSAIRRLTDKWNTSQLIENLRTIETQILRLNERENHIINKCKHKGLW